MSFVPIDTTMAGRVFSASMDDLRALDFMTALRQVWAVVMSIVLNINFTVVGLVIAAGLLLFLVIALPTFRNRILGALAAVAALVAGYYYVFSPAASAVKKWWSSDPTPTDTTALTATAVPATSWVPDISWTEWFWKLLPFVAALAALILFVAFVRRMWSGGGGAPRAPWFPWRTLFQLMGILLVVGLVAAGIGHWPKIEAWLTAHNFSTAEFSAYISSMDMVAKVLLGAALFGVLLLALGGGVRSVAAVGALAALFLVLHSVSWSEVKASIKTWEQSVVQNTTRSQNPLPTYCRVQNVGVVSLTDTKWALPQNCRTHIVIYQGTLRAQDNQGNIFDADANIPWNWPHWFEPILVWSKTPTTQVQFAFEYKR